MKRIKIMLSGGNVRKISFLLVCFIVLASNVSAKDYVIGDGDTLQISVWGSPELSLTTTVRPDGKIALPALGEIKASGLSPIELTSFLKQEMTKLVKAPTVTVIVTNITNYRIFVFGRGAPAGVNILARETTLLQFLSRLGSLPNADLESAYLVRDKKMIKTDFSELYEKGDFSQDIVLEPNDMLFIPDNFEKRVVVVGAVNTPTTLDYREGLTIVDVILSAGGLTQFAKGNDVLILRKMKSGKNKEISVRVKDVMKGNIKETVIIEPGDFVVVKESLF